MFQVHRVHEEAAMPASRSKARSRRNRCSSHLTESQIKHYLGIPEDGYDPSMFALATTLPLSGFPTEYVHLNTGCGAIECRCHHPNSKSRFCQNALPRYHAGNIPMGAASGQAGSTSHSGERWELSGESTSAPYKPSRFQDQGISTVPLQTNFNLSRELEPGNVCLLWASSPSTSTVSMDKAPNLVSNYDAGELKGLVPLDPTSLSRCDGLFGIGERFYNDVLRLDGSANDSSTTSQTDMGHHWDGLAGDAFRSALPAQPPQAVGCEEYSNTTGAELLTSYFSHDLVSTPEATNLLLLHALVPLSPSQHPSQFWPTDAEDQSVRHDSMDIDNTADRILDELAETIDSDGIDQTTQDSSVDAMEDGKSGNLSDMEWLAMFGQCTEQHEQQQEQQNLANVTDSREEWWKQFFSDVDSLEIQPDYTNDQSETMHPSRCEDGYID